MPNEYNPYQTIPTDYSLNRSSKVLNFLSRQQATRYYGISAPTFGLRHAFCCGQSNFGFIPAASNGESSISGISYFVVKYNSSGFKPYPGTVLLIPMV